MDHPAKPDFLDDTGRPLAAHIQGVLRVLAPRLQRRFPALKDPAVITDVLEEAGRRISDLTLDDGRTLDPGRTYKVAGWAPVREGVAVDPVTPANVYCSINGSGIYKSTNSGTTWVKLADVLPLKLPSMLV